MRNAATTVLALFVAAFGFGCGSAGGDAPTDEIATSAEALWIDGDFQRLPESRGDLLSYIEQLPVASAFNHDDARDARIRAMMNAIFDARVSGSWCTAVALAGAANYTLTRFYDEGTYQNGARVRRYFVVARDTSGQGDATIVINPNPARNVLIESPHSDSERGTRGEGVFLFRELGARGLILNGAHRCASTRASTCTPPGGGVDICGKWEGNYRKSDVAHWTENAFHDAHVSFDVRFATRTVQLHEFSPVSNWWAVSSDGTRPSSGERSGSISVLFRNALSKRIPNTVRAGACQCEDDGAHPTLCGDLNLQGRFTNQGTDAVCTTSSPTANDRFLHLEQHPSLAAGSRPAVRDALIDVWGACEASGAADCPAAQLTRPALAACN